jgi:predicted S18 family serine protease
MQKKIFLYFLFACLLLITCNQASAKKMGHITLLAVTDGDRGENGSLADVYLELIPGNGRVFLDTFPLTRQHRILLSLIR